MTHEFAIPRLRSSATVKELDCVSFWSGLEYFESLAHLRISSPQSFVPYQHLLSCDNELPVAYFVYATYCKLVIFACYSTHMRLLREFSFYEFERKTTRGRILECLFSPNSQKPILCCTFSTGEVLLLDLSQRAISFTVQQIHFQFQLENPLCCWLDDANFVLSTDSTFYGCNINQKLFSVHHASNRISCFQMFRQDSHYLAIGLANGEIEIWKVSGSIKKRTFSQICKLNSGLNEVIKQLTFSSQLKRYKQPPLASLNGKWCVQIWDIASGALSFQFDIDRTNVWRPCPIAFQFIADETSKYLQLCISNAEGSLVTVPLPDSPNFSLDFKVCYNPIERNFGHDCKSNRSLYTPVHFATLPPINTLQSNVPKQKKGTRLPAKFQSNLPFAIQLKALPQLEFEFLYWNLESKKVLQRFHSFTTGVNMFSLNKLKCDTLIMAANQPICFTPKISEKSISFQKLSFPVREPTKTILSVCCHPFEENTYAAIVSFDESIHSIFVFTLGKQLYNFHTSKSSKDIYRLCWGPDLAKNDFNAPLAIYFIQTTNESGNSTDLHFYSLSLNHDFKFNDWIDMNVSLATMKDVEVTDFCWSPNFRYLCIFCKNENVIFYEHKAGKLKLSFEVNVHLPLVWCSAWQMPSSIANGTTDGKLAFGSDNAVIKVINFTTAFESKDCATFNDDFVLMKSLIGHTRAILDVQWSPFDRDLLASASKDCLVIIWNVTNATPCAYFADHSRSVYSVMWYPTKEHPDLLLSVGKADALYAWRMSKQPKEKPKPIGNRFAEEDVIHVDYALSEENGIEIEDATVNGVEHRANEDDETKRNKKKSKKIGRTSLMSCLNRMENSITQAEQYQDLQVILNKTIHECQDESQSDRLLLYGQEKDAEKLLRLEANNYASQNDLDLADLASFLSRDLRKTITKAMEEKRLTGNMVAISPQVSYIFWEKTVASYAEQLEEKGEIILAATYLISSLKDNSGLEMLIRHGYYSEALVTLKCIHPPDSIKVREFTAKTAAHCASHGQVDTAIKLYASIDSYYEAAALLSRRPFDAHAMHLCVQLCKKGWNVAQNISNVRMPNNRGLPRQSFQHNHQASMHTKLWL